MPRRIVVAVALCAALGATGACTRGPSTALSPSASTPSRLIPIQTATSSESLAFVGPEAGFAGGRDDQLFAAALDPAGRLIAAGRTRDPGGRDHALLLLLEPSNGEGRAFTMGTAVVVDAPGGPANANHSRVLFDVAVDARGRVIAVGQSGPPGGSKALILRFLPDGRLDSTFGDLEGRGPARKGFTVGMGDEFLADAFVPVPPEELLPDERFTAVALDAQGRILAAGMTGDRGPAFKEDVARCGRFPFDPCPGRLLRALVVRWTEAGVLDTTFHKTGYSLGRTAKSSWSGGAREVAFDLVTLPDGSVIAAGFASPSEAERVPLMVKLTPHGKLDETFAAGRGFTLGGPRSRAGGAREELHALAIDPTGKIVASGISWDDAAGAHTVVARYLATGATDTTFAEAGFAIDDRTARPELAATLSLDDHEPIIARGPRLSAASASGSWDAAFGARAARTTETASITVGHVLVQPSTRAILAVGASEGRAVVLVTGR